MKAQQLEAQQQVDEMMDELKAKVYQFEQELQEDIYSIMELLDYQSSSNFSYHIDRLKAFCDEILK